jgi:hypothetical protein
MSTICMKLDPGMHIGIHLVCFSKTRCDTRAPGTSPRLVVRPLGHGRRRLRANSSDRRRGWLGKEVGTEFWLTNDPFVAEEGSGATLASGHGGAAGRQPLELVLRQRGRRSGVARDCQGFTGGCGRRGKS